MDALDVTRDLTRVLGERTLLRWELRGLKRALSELSANSDLADLWHRVVSDWKATKCACAKQPEALMFLTMHPLHEAEDLTPLKLPLTTNCGKGTPRAAFKAYEISHAKYAKAYKRISELVILIEERRSELKLCHRTIRDMRNNRASFPIEVEANQRVWLWLCPDAVRKTEIEIYFCNAEAETVAIATLPLRKLLKKLRRVPHPKWPMRMACLLVTQIYFCSFSNGRVTATPIEHWETLKELKQTLK